MIIFDECGMVARDIFGAVCLRLVEAHIDIDEMSFVFFGDPAQCEPIGGVPPWSTQPVNKNRKNWQVDNEGLLYFRDILNMLPLKQFPFHKEREKLLAKLNNKKKLLSEEEIKRLEFYEEEFGKFVYKGSFRAVYLDEVKRSDGSPESKVFIDKMIKCRYGKYTYEDLEELGKIIATDEEASRPEWKNNSTLLTSYHYYSEKNPNRTNADTPNARNLVCHAEAINEPVMLFKAVHSPEADADDLAELTSKEFHGLPNNLYLIPGAPVIITCNINATVSLYNGARATFVGPIYTIRKYSITDFDTFVKAAVSSTTFKTTKQIEIKLSGSKKQLPRGTSLVQINGSDVDANVLGNITSESFRSASFQLPRQPPHLPDYLVLNVEGYSEANGPVFFPNNEGMKNYVCIKPFTREKDSKKKGKHVPKTRTQFPIELAYVMTAFKGIGANHKHTIAKLNGMFDKPGLFLVACTRVRNPKDLHIPSDHWPHVEDLLKQRTYPTVLESENFDRIVRAKSAKEWRKSDYHESIPHFPVHIDKDIVNFIADLIHDCWVEKGYSAKKDPKIQYEIKTSVLDKCNFPAYQSQNKEDLYEEIISFMKSTDESRLLKKAPCLDIRAIEAQKNVKKAPKSQKKRGRDKLEEIPEPQSKRKHAPKVTPPSIVGLSRVIVPSVDGNETNDTNPITDSIAPFGLHNTGSSCYINASVQLLLALNVHHLNMQNEGALVCMSDIASADLECAMQFFSDIVSKPSGSSLTPTNFNNSVYALVYDINEVRQEDVTRVLDSLILNPYLFRASQFKISMESTVTCDRCATIYPTHHKEYSLILSVPTHNETLQNVVHRYFEEEQLSADNLYKCNSCGVHGDAKKKNTMCDPSPDILIINLGRFFNHSREKNRNEIDLENYTLSIAAHEKLASVQYELYSAISHSGDSINHGHYIAHVRKENRWYKCNDAKITLCLRSEIPKDDVYILAFKKSTNISAQVLHSPTSLNQPLCSGSSAPSNLLSPARPTVCAFIENEKVELCIGDITHLHVDCYVNAANEDLMVGEGVDRAIHRAAGPDLHDFCKNKYGFCNTGDAVLTPGFRLNADWVIHTVGPQNGDKIALRKCYENTLDLALRQNGLIKTIAFPCISTGVYGFDRTLAAEVALNTVRKWLSVNKSVLECILFCTYEKDDYDIYKKLMAKYLSD